MSFLPTRNIFPAARRGAGALLRFWRSNLAAADVALAACGLPACMPVAETEGALRNDAALRSRMVREQIAGRGVQDERVLEAMRRVPRHAFVPVGLQAYAYDDGPLPIGAGQTISQPYIVAYMTEALQLSPGDRVLEVGTGCGYQAAVLGELVKEVYTVEIVEVLADSARRKLKELGYDNVHVRAGDGYRGWAEHAPYDAIMVTAAPDHVPEALIEQLKPGGRLILPLGTWWQELVRVTKTSAGLKRERLLPVRFVPMTGEARAD